MVGELGTLCKLSCLILKMGKPCSLYPASGARSQEVDGIVWTAIVFQEAEREGHEVWPRMACMNVECHSDCHYVSLLSPFLYLLVK